MTTKDIKLYSYFRSSASYRVRLALGVKDLDYEYIPVHLLNNGGEQNSEAYRQINPMAQVPSLEYDGALISQSMAIVLFLEDQFPNKPLLPADKVEKAKIIEFCELINSGMQPLQNLSVTRFLTKDLGINEKDKSQWLLHWLHKGLKSLNSMIEPNSHFVSGNSLSLAECFLLPQLFSCRRMGVEMHKYENLLSIEEHCKELPAVIKAHPDNQPDAQ